MLQIVLLVLCVLLALATLYLYTRLQSAPTSRTASVSSVSQDEMFQASSLPMCYFKESRFTCNKAFENTFGNFAKETQNTLLTLPKCGEHTIELTFDNAITKPSLVYLTPLFKSGATTHDFLATIVEISALQQSKTTLMTQKERLELALESANEALWDWDMKNETVFYSQRWKHIMGYAPNDTPSTLSSWLNLVHSKDMAMVNERLKMHIDGQSDCLVIEHRIRQSDPLQWVKVKAKTIRGKHDEAIRMIGTLQDITRQKAQTLQDTLEHQRYVAFFEQLPFPAFIQNSQGAYLYLNHAFQKFLGFRSWYHKYPNELFDEAGADAIVEMDRLTLYEGLLNHSLSLPTQEGLTISFDVSTFVIENENDEKLICGFCVNKSFRV